MRLSSLAFVCAVAARAVRFRHIVTGEYVGWNQKVQFYGSANHTRYFTFTPLADAIVVNLREYSAEKPFLMRLLSTDGKYEVTYTNEAVENGVHGGGNCFYQEVGSNTPSESTSTSIVLTSSGYYTLVSNGKCLQKSPDGNLRRMPCDKNTSTQYFAIEDVDPLTHPTLPNSPQYIAHTTSLNTFVVDPSASASADTFAPVKIVPNTLSGSFTSNGPMDRPSWATNPVPDYTQPNVYRGRNLVPLASLRPFCEIKLLSSMTNYLL